MQDSTDNFGVEYENCPREISVYLSFQIELSWASLSSILNQAQKVGQEENAYLDDGVHWIVFPYTILDCITESFLKYLLKKIVIFSLSSLSAPSQDSKKSYNLSFTVEVLEV